MTTRSVDIRFRYLDTEDADRLYAAHSAMRPSPDEFCPTCAKTGTYTWQGTTHTCDCELQLQLYKHYLNAGIGDTFQRLDWTDFEGEALDDALAGIWTYLENHTKYVTRGIGLSLYGDLGTGKSMLGHLILKQLIKQGYRCYASVFRTAVKLFTDGWRSPEDEEFFTRKFFDTDVLLLDDLGKEYGTRIVEPLLDNILRERVQHSRPTLITTNLLPVDLEQRYGEGIASLLAEKNFDHYFTGADFRRTAKSRTQDEMKRGEMRPIF